MAQARTGTSAHIAYIDGLKGLCGIWICLFHYLLAFAAGAMMYVVVEELIPETAEGEHSNIGTIGFAVGFALMMMLDVALG